MRCQDVTRELANPTGTPASAKLAEHLASCPACAARAEGAARLDRAWAETRPAGPSPAQLDQLWLKASAALDSIPDRAPAHARIHARRRRFVYAGVGLVLAQAAALLLMARHREAAPRALPVPTVAVEIGEFKVVHIDDDNGHQVETLTANPPTPLDPTRMDDDTPHDAMNQAESMAQAAKLASNIPTGGDASERPIQ